MERWLAEHVSAEARRNTGVDVISSLSTHSLLCEQDAVRLGGKGRPDGGHPIANKMADFALETQGRKHLTVVVGTQFDLVHVANTRTFKGTLRV